MFNTDYRIMPDNWLGFECQKRVWWFPFWLQMGTKNHYLSNTFETREQAEELISQNKGSRKRFIKC